MWLSSDLHSSSALILRRLPLLIPPPVVRSLLPFLDFRPSILFVPSITLSTSLDSDSYTLGLIFLALRSVKCSTCIWSD